MARDGNGPRLFVQSGPPLAFFSRAASATPSPTLLRHVSVFFRVLMTIFAVCPLALFFGKRLSTKCKVALVHIPGFCGDFCIGHSFGGAGNNRGNLQSALVAKVNSLVPHTLNGHVDCVAPIANLLFSAGPAAVFWRVIAVIVNAVKGVTLGALAHISRKSGVGIYPTLADSDAPSPVIMILFGRRAVTAAFHGLPNGVIRRNLFEWHDFSSMSQRVIRADHYREHCEEWKWRMDFA